MKRIVVKTASRNYEVVAGSGLLAEAGKRLRRLLPSPGAVVITNPTVQQLHGETLERGLAASGFTASFLTVPEGEESKTLKTADMLYAALNTFKAERTTPIIAFGGGVIGDLAGFVAATYKRGMPLVQIPTTLMAQVDSSIGGKTAIDHAGIKNSVGAFYQPLLVIADTAALHTLPEVEIRNGLAEVIKYGVIGDSTLFKYLETNMQAILDRDNTKLETIVARSAAIKARIVGRDERDTGDRNLLNFCHTIGHGIESASDFTVSHGQAVAIGMLLAGSIAVRLGTFDGGSLDRLKRLINKAGLLAEKALPSSERIIEAISHDKKIMNGKLRFILPRSIGHVFISHQVDIRMIKEALESDLG